MKEGSRERLRTRVTGREETGSVFRPPRQKSGHVGSRVAKTGGVSRSLSRFQCRLFWSVLPIFEGVLLRDYEGGRPSGLVPDQHVQGLSLQG